jgi:uncharacterized protein (TIGR03437 family)
MTKKLLIGWMIFLAVLPAQQPRELATGKGEILSMTRRDAAAVGAAGSGSQLTSGVTTPFTLPLVSALTHVNGEYGYTITVPAGATTLDIRLVTTTPGIDVDLYVHYGSDVDLDSNHQPVADYRAEDVTGNEALLITTGSTPPLRAGTYYIAFGVFNPGAPSGTINATVGNTPNPATPPPVSYAWQTDWNAFVDAIAPFLRTAPLGSTGSFIDHPKYHGKQVSWQGLVGGNYLSDASKNYVSITMPTRKVTFSNGSSDTWDHILVFPKTPNLGSWSPVKVGDQVRYRTTLGDSLGIVTVFVLSGVTLSFVNIGDAELLGLPPAITQNGVVNGASFQPGISPGSWFSIQGAHLSNSTRIWGTADFQGSRLPTSLDGVSVQVNGKDAPVYYVSGTQLNALAPSDSAIGPVNVTVKNGDLTASTTANLQTFAPAFFTFDPENRKYLAAVHLDGALIGKTGLLGNGTTTRPASQGERILLFGTGFGPTNPRVPTDQVFNGAAPLVDSSQLALRIGGVPATVEFAGMTGAGLYQFNAIVPIGSAGDLPVVAEVGGTSSQANVFLTVAADPGALVSVSPAALSFSYQSGGAIPPTRNLSVASVPGSMDFTVSATTASGGNWLSVAPSTGTTPATVTVSVNPAGLPAGSYNGTVRIAAAGAANSPLSIAVALIAGPATPLPSSYTISTIAGAGVPGFAGDGGPASSARFGALTGFANVSIAVDNRENIYIGDTGNNRIRRIEAGSAIITTIAGTGARNSSGDGGPATQAEIHRIGGIAVGAQGHIWFSEIDASRVRRIDAATGIVTTVAGTGTNGFSGDGGPGTQARLSSPGRLAVDSTGNVFFMDGGNLRIRKIDSKDGKISTVVHEINLSVGSGFAMDPQANLYFVIYNATTVMMAPAGADAGTIFAGNGISAFGGDDGPATDAKMSNVDGLAVNQSGDLFVADSLNHRIRVVPAGSGVIRTVAGSGPAGTSGGGFSGDNGPALNALLRLPSDVAIGPSGHIFFPDQNGLVIRALTLASAPVPVITAVQPNAGVLGQTIALQIGGSNLGGVAGVEFSPGDGITVTNVRASASSVTASVVIASNASTGARQVALLYSGGKSNSLQFTVNAFPNTSNFTLTVMRTGTGSGLITSSPVGINCGNTCLAAFAGGTSVTLSPLPSSGAAFGGWSGACSGSGSCTLVLDANKTVTATFTDVSLNGTYAGNFTGETTTTIPGCSLKQSISGSMTTVISGGTGTASNPFTGTFSASGTDVITLISGPGCQGSVMSLAVSGQVSGSAGKVEATGTIPGLGTLRFAGGTFSGTSLTGALTMTSDYFDQPITGPITMTKR